LKIRKFKAIMKEKEFKGEKPPKTFLALFAPRENEEDVQIFHFIFNQNKAYCEDTHTRKTQLLYSLKLSRKDMISLFL